MTNERIGFLTVFAVLACANFVFALYSIYHNSFLGIAIGIFGFGLMSMMFFDSRSKFKAEESRRVDQKVIPVSQT